LLVTGRNRDDFSNKELYDYGMKILSMIYEVKEVDVTEDSNN